MVPKKRSLKIRKPSRRNRNKTLRSSSWFQPQTGWGIIHRASIMAEGYSPQVFDGRPVIGICNSWSELTNCNANLRTLAEAVKRGVWRAGGFPLEFPTISLGEPFMKPTTMLFRNLMSIDVEESIEANPLDAVVLLCGCDKTIPAQILGAVSANIPAILLTSGPMLRSTVRGRPLGSGHDIMDYLNEYRSGLMTREDLEEIEKGICRSAGHCMVMGTASTMACMTEAMGFMLPGGASIPAADSRRIQLAEQTGEVAVDLAFSDRCPKDIFTPAGIENAIRVLHAIGGSTNAIIHLIAIARRLGYDLRLSHFDLLGRNTPFIVDLMPSGKFVMEDFHEAGGVQALLGEMQELLNRECLTVTGETIGDWVEKARSPWNHDVIRSLKSPLSESGSLASLYGSLAPEGAVIKTSAASPRLLKHRGPAFVFEDYHLGC